VSGVLAFALAPSPGVAQETGSFVRTGDMVVSRSQHTATLLQDGRVLITGGVTNAVGNYSATVLASAELYDPTTGTFVATGTMSAARRMHTATLLPDGRVLIAGGYDWFQPIGSAELYDPASGTFTTVGGLLNSRGGHDALLLNNGTVLIAGGFDGRYPLIPGAEVYDPGAGIFTAVGPVAGRASCDFCPPSVLLADGKVLFALQQPAQLFDPLTGAYSSTGSPNSVESAATLLMNGRVLFTGGEDWGRSKSAELYDPATGTFAVTGDMKQRRVWHALTLLPDGTVLATGGETDDCSGNYCYFAGSLASAELFDPSTGFFADAGQMTTSRETHTATLLNDGRVLIAGGVGYGGIGLFYGSTATAEVYTPRALVPAPTLLSSAESDDGFILHAGTDIVVSGENPAVAGDTLEIRFTGLRGESVIPPRVTIGGRLAETLFFVTQPDSAGVSAVFVRVPSGIEPGLSAAVRLSYIGRTSNRVTLAVR